MARPCGNCQKVGHGRKTCPARNGTTSTAKGRRAPTVPTEAAAVLPTNGTGPFAAVAADLRARAAVKRQEADEHEALALKLEALA